MACAIFLPYGILAKAALLARLGPAAHVGQLHAGELVVHLLQYGATQRRDREHAGAGRGSRPCVGAGLVALLAYVTNRRLVRGPPAAGLPRAGAGGHPGRGAGGRAVHRLHAAAASCSTARWDPVHRLPDQGDAGRLLAVRRDLSRASRPSWRTPGRILGAGRLRVLRDVTAPLARSGIIAAWCFIFIGVIRELSASIILFTPTTKVMSVVIFDLKEEGQFGAIAVLGPGDAGADLRHRRRRAGRARPRRARSARVSAGAGGCHAGREHPRPHPALRRPRRRGEPVARGRAGRAGRAARPVGLRQDDHAAAGGGLPDAGGRRDLGGGPVPVVAGQRRAARAAADGDDLPELCAVAAHDGGPERRLRSALQAGVGRTRPRAARQRDAARRAAGRLRGALSRASCSGGQQQRVAVARALVVEPEILLLDEPLSNLDANLREEMRFEIRRLHEAFGITTLYVTHDQAEAMVISDRIAVLERGRVVQTGTGRRAVRPAAHPLRRRVHRQAPICSTASPPRRTRWRWAACGFAWPARGADARDPGGRVDPPARDRARPSRWTTPRPEQRRCGARSSARATSATAWTTRSRSPTATSCCAS